MRVWRPPQSRRSQQYCHCPPHFDKLIDWLRDHSVDRNKPLHSLRKEYGSLITQAHVIDAASRAQRHTDLRTTSEHYLGSRSRATPGSDVSWFQKVEPLSNPIGSVLFEPVAQFLSLQSEFPRIRFFELTEIL